MDVTYIDLVKNLVAAALGGIGAIVVTKIRNKTACISYHWTCNRIALSANDSVFGEVRVTWQGTPVRNLHMFVFDIENSTTQDYENVELRVYCGNDTLILNEKTEMLDTPYIVQKSEKYQERIYVAPDTEPTEQQLAEYRHNREYSIAVFNRGQKLRLQFLCNRPNDDEMPMLFITTPSRGIRLKLTASPSVTLNPIWGAPIPAAILRALLISVAVIIGCVVYIQNVATASVICMVIGLTGQIFGAALYKLERFIRHLITG